MEETKVCKTCGEQKPRSEFRTDPGYTDNKRNDCKQCESNKTKARQEAKRNEYAGMGLSDIYHYENQKAYENRISY